MNQTESLIEKLYHAINVINCESKIAKDYGTEHKLTYSDISLLKCIQRNENSKAGDLSQYLGMTNGAVTQLAKKLENKGYLEPYRTTGNKKEVYYKLTGIGEKACAGYDSHYDKIKGSIESYISTLDNETIGKITGLFDAVADSASVDKNCYIKHSSCDGGKPEEESIGRCEKCKRIY